MSKLIIHAKIGRIGVGLHLNEEIRYREALDSIRVIDTFYVRYRIREKSFTRDF